MDGICMKLVFSWDDGALEDLRLFKLHEKYEIPGIFFVPTKNCEGRSVLTPEMIRDADARWISFGSHTENHTYLTNIPIESVDGEIRENKNYIENILGHEIEHFCLPGGKYTKDILYTVYKYFRTVRTADTMNFKNTGRLCKPSFHYYPRGKKSLIVNGIRNGSVRESMYVAKLMKWSYFDILHKLIEIEADKMDSRIVIWGHGWEIEKMDLWGELERTMKYIACEYKGNCVRYDNLWTSD